MKKISLHLPRLLFLLSILVWGTSVRAAEPASFIVKTMSSKARQSSSFTGSGVLVQFEGKVYVLTSEHVVLHDNIETQHRFLFDGQAPQNMSYLSSDWAKGLALLEASGVQPGDGIPKLESLLNAPQPQVDQTAITIGFPARSTSLTADTEGKIASATRTSVILVDVEQMLEIKGAHAEFGMSGGAVLDDNGEPLGILSHEKPDKENKLIYAVPIRVAANWAHTVLTTPGYQPELMRSSDDMLSGRGYAPAVRSQDLIFRFELTADYDRRDVRAVTISGDRKANGVPTRLFDVPFMKKAAAKIRPMWEDVVPIGYHPRVTVAGFVREDILQHQQTRVPITGIVDFFRKHKNLKGHRPLAQFTYQGSNEMHRSWEFNRYADRFKYGQISAPGELGRRLRAIGEIVQYHEYSSFQVARSQPIYFLRAEDLEDLVNSPNYRTDWNELGKRGPEYVTGLKTFLLEISKLIKDISL